MRPNANQNAVKDKRVPGKSITSLDDLKGKTIWVIGGEVNHKVVDALANAYDPARTQLHFKDLTVADIPRALKSKKINAVLVVMPVTEKYLTMLRNLFPRSAKQNSYSDSDRFCRSDRRCHKILSKL